VSKLIHKRIDSIPKIVKRIPFYFMLTASSISFLAVIQYLTLEHMPIWNAAAAGIPNHQMVDFTTAGDGRMVAAYIDFSERLDLPNHLCVSFINTVDSTKNIDIFRPISTRSAISPCGNWLASSDHDGNVFLFSPDASSKESILLSELGKGVTGLIWSNDSKRMLVRTESSLLLVNIAEKIVTALPIELANRVVAYTGPDCFLAGTGNKYCLFDWKTGEVVREVPIESEAKSISFSADLKYMAYSVGTTVRLFDLWEDKLMWSREYRVPWHTQNSVSFARDNRSLAVVSTTGQDFDDFVVNIIDVDSQREVCSRRFQNEVISGVHFATDDSMWLWSSDGSIRKWDWHSQVQGQQDGLLIVRQLRMPEFK
jgi:WD40 repeat protein